MEFTSKYKKEKNKLAIKFNLNKLFNKKNKSSCYLKPHYISMK